jgi:hypothetical protein
MPISTEERNGIVCVKWTTQIEEGFPFNGSSSESFQLNRFLKYVYELNVSCAYNEIMCLGRNRKFCMELCLKQIGGPKDDSSSTDDDREAVPDYYLHPCAVCCVCVVNGQLEKIPLKNSPSSNEWKSERFIAQLTSPTVTCQLLIKFNTVGVSEMKALKQTTDYLFLQQTNCDVRFYFEDGQHIGGHVNILSARSPVFAAMFNHDMQEAKTGIVIIRDFQRNIFFHLLHYIYSGRLILTTMMTVGTAKSLFEAADKYHIEDLKEECASLIFLGVNVKTAINLMIWGHLYSIDKIKQAALDVVVRNGKEICLTSDWEWLTKDHPDLCIMATRRMMEVAQLPSAKRKWAE